MQRLVQRWGDSATAKVKMDTLLQVSVSTVNRDLLSVRERQALPVMCPLCHLPWRIDLDPADLTADPAALARLERAMARLVGADPDAAAPRRRRPSARLSRHLL